jgi:hypothetical protein
MEVFMAKDGRESGVPRLVDARVRCDWRGFQPCDVRELDMHGVFVLGRDGTLSRLPKDAAVDVALKMQSEGQTRTHVLRARIEKKTVDGMSLIFTDADIDTYSVLLHFGLNGEPPG